MSLSERRFPGVYAITDRVAVEGELVDAVCAAFATGLRWLQIREKDMSPADLVDLTRRIVAEASGVGARVLVNDRADVALAAGADGVHLTEASMAVADVRRAFPQLLIGVSVHSLAGARAAAAAGADFVLLGPIHPTPSTEGIGEPLGLQLLREVSSKVDAPIIAVGGIGAEEAGDCLRAGAKGVAATRGLLGAVDVAAATRAFLYAVGD